MNDVMLFDEVVKSLEKKKRITHLLLGNGFSMAFDNNIFSYNALSNFIDKTDDDILKKLFGVMNTKNFEQIMQQLDNFCEIAQIFSNDKALAEKIKGASETLKSSLINAVKELHPEHVFTIPATESANCSQFLHRFLANGGKIFTANYDLLLYWVLMRNNSKLAVDGFGRDVENPDDIILGESAEFSDLRWGKYRSEQSIFYVHGALPLFDTGIDVVKEEYDTQNYLLDKIRSRMEQKDYPIFVTAGTAKDKLNHIMHNKYLSFCYDSFSSISGSLVTFGFNFGDFDTHIIDAINKAANHGKPAHHGEKLYSIYIGVYSQADQQHIERIKNKFKCKVHLYDATTVNIWR